MNKKLLAGILALVLIFSLAACGKKTEAPAPAAPAAPAETPAAPAAPAQPEAPAEPAAPEVAVNSGVVTFNIDMTKYEAGQTVKVWVPVAQTNEYQTIKDVAFEASVDGLISTDAEGNQMFYVEWDENAAPEDRKASLSFHVDRPEIIRPELKEEGTIGAGFENDLKGSAMVTVTDPAVVKLAKEITEGKTTVLDQARAVYDWIYDNMVRDNSVVGCGQGDVCTLINTKGGKCTDINSVFVSLCRINGIPAREMFGVRINADDITNNEHCWAEFYLPGTGWVAADPADVLKAILTNDWDKSSAEALEKKEYYWGSNDNLRVELSRGRDLVLAPAQDGAPLNDFGYPYAEVNGEMVDFYAPAEFVYTISFVADK